jgi:hypothetical protein
MLSRILTEHPNTLPTCCSNNEGHEESGAEENMIPKKLSSWLYAASVTSISNSADADFVVATEFSERKGSTEAIVC